MAVVYTLGDLQKEIKNMSQESTVSFHLAGENDALLCLILNLTQLNLGTGSLCIQFIAFAFENKEPGLQV